MEWTEWRRHIDQVVKDEGRWIGLCDGWGKPIMRMPPHLNLSAPESRFAAGTLDLTVQTLMDGVVSPVVDHMVAEGLGVFDETGALIVKDNIVDMIAVVTRGFKRGYVTSYPVAQGGDLAPTSLKVHGTDLLDLLQMWVCPSVPQSWVPNQEIWLGDVVEYETPREVATMEFATVADGFTMSGPAEDTIKTLIQDSFDSVNHQNGWSATPHLVVDMTPTGNESPHVNIRVQDQMISETVFPIAQMAGVNIRVELWWPGDDPVLVRTPDRQSTVLTSWDRAIGVVKIEQIGG
ncbi:hypothetical protein [Corynebacterium glutamicum]|uniref:hypothetical protein n=1 Tax=Corynebacterium glutamicum TaxID=1718 RepID=UPI0014697EFF|nr:hypothetical protein [Corynebacterium glutamicum]GFK19194.1 hypothetical protein KbCgl_17660 [Corynebacterium glutamicum]